MKGTKTAPSVPLSALLVSISAAVVTASMLKCAQNKWQASSFQQNYGEKSIGRSAILALEMPRWSISCKQICPTAMTP